jgi:hypothetical protein
MDIAGLAHGGSHTMSEDRSRTMGRIVRTVAVATLAMSCTAHAADTPAPSDWPIASRDYAGWRFADLGDINAGNVANLKVAFTFSTGVVRGHEAAPVVAGGTMYIITPYPNVVYALDLTKPGAPVKWQFEPKPLAASQGVACCDVVSGGLPVHERPRVHDAERLMGHQRLRFRGVVPARAAHNASPDRRLRHRRAGGPHVHWPPS